MTSLLEAVPADLEDRTPALHDCAGCSRPAALAHNLRNLISGLGLVAEELQAAGDARLRELGRRVDVALTRAIRLCRAAEGREPLALPSSFARGASLAAILGDAGLVARTMAGERTAVLVKIDGTAARTSIPSRHADVLFLTLMNLLWNAVTAVNGTGNGRVSLRPDPGHPGTSLLVEDSGPGIPPSVLAWLVPFLKDNQVPHGREASGLVIAAAGARRLGGRLVLVRTGPGGTLFQLDLPASLAS